MYTETEYAVSTVSSASRKFACAFLSDGLSESQRLRVCTDFLALYICDVVENTGCIHKSGVFLSVCVREKKR